MKLCSADDIVNQNNHEFDNEDNDDILYFSVKREVLKLIIRVRSNVGDICRQIL